MKGKARAGLLEKDKTFAEAAEKFSEEYEAVTKGHRSPKWVQGHKDRIRLHLLPYLGSTSPCLKSPLVLRRNIAPIA